MADAKLGSSDAFNITDAVDEQWQTEVIHLWLYLVVNQISHILSMFGMKIAI